MRQFQIQIDFAASSERDARELSDILSTMVSAFCGRDRWALHIEEEGAISAARS